MHIKLLLAASAREHDVWRPEPDHVVPSRMAAPTPPPGAPPPSTTAVFVRGKSAAKQVLVGPPVTDDAAVRCAPVDALAEYSAVDGSFLAMVEPTGVRVIRSADGAEVFSTPRPQIQAISLSPLGTFLLTWERLQEGEEAGNLRVWRVATGEIVCSWQQKVLGEKAQWPALKWSSDEELAFRLVTNTVHFFDGHNPTQAVVHSLRIEGVSQCSLQPSGAPHHIATFVPEKKGAPAQLRLWLHGDYGEGRFLQTKSFYKADQVSMLWNPAGGSMLVHTHTDVDTTGKSYMGETGLYFMPLTSKKVQNVTLRKEGPIHDVQWSPLGTEFVRALHAHSRHTIGRAARTARGRSRWGISLRIPALAGHTRGGTRQGPCRVKPEAAHATPPAAHAKAVPAIHEPRCTATAHTAEGTRLEVAEVRACHARSPDDVSG